MFINTTAVTFPHGIYNTQILLDKKELFFKTQLLVLRIESQGPMWTGQVSYQRAITTALKRIFFFFHGIMKWVKPTDFEENTTPMVSFVSKWENYENKFKFPCTTKHTNLNYFFKVILLMLLPENEKNHKLYLHQEEGKKKKKIMM